MPPKVPVSVKRLKALLAAADLACENAQQLREELQAALKQRRQRDQPDRTGQPEGRSVKRR